MLSAKGMLGMGLSKMTCGMTLFLIQLIRRAQYASLDALSALISAEAFQSTSASGQLKIIVPALVEILARSTKSPKQLRLKFLPHSNND